MKLPLGFNGKYINIQPPSGGCVLKQGQIMGVKRFNGPAAFRRLCVETFIGIANHR